MAESRRHALGNQLDIEQILLEAQHRWLRPAEICEILRNYKKFRISSEPAHMPPSGSLFLFDRKVLRYFRKDGHSWRKKKDGKTVKEAHERLKAGSVDVLHCYYAHGEEDENFQRRSYWMLEDELSHMVLVHYREVKGNRSNFSRSKEKEDAIHYSHESEEFIANPEIDSSTSSIFHPNNYQVPLQTTDTTSLNSAQASEYEDAESAYNHQASSRFQPFLELQQPVMEKIDAGLSNSHHPVHLPNDYPGKFSYSSGTDFISTSRSGNNDGLTYEPLKHLNFQSWGDLMENTSSGIHPVAFQQSDFCTEADGIRTLTRQGNDMSSNVFMDNLGKRHELQEEGQISAGDFLDLPKWSVFQKKYPTSAYNLTAEFHESLPDGPTDYPLQWDLQEDLSGAEHESYVKSEVESNLATGGKTEYSAILKRSLLDGSLTEEGLKKLDSFNRWMSKELGDVDESVVQSCSEALWDTVDNENVVTDSGLPQTQLDTCVVGPSLSQDQLFSIIDFSPNWVYAGSEIKVLITGRFLRNQQDVEECKWSCMFGEVEVPAEVIADGVLRCHAPLHQAGRVPFYVTCSNRLACSEVREFEYRVKSIHDVSMEDTYNGSMSESLLRMRFVKLLSSESECSFDSISINMPEKSNLRSKISSLMKEDGGEWDQMLTVTSEDFSLSEIKEQLLQKLLKEKLHAWLLHKTAEGGKGPSILDESGQGVLHFAAALGYDWAILPTIVAGVSVNFRDVNGWTALHWAASRGRERTVVSLISLGAAPGALTDPTPKYPSGRTPADLASANRHKGIAGYLAESSLSAQLEILDLKEMKDGDSVDRSGVKAVQTVSERIATPNQDGDLPYGLSLKDSLEAVRNATQAAARIHQVFRVHSFQQKKLREYGDNKCGISDERALSLVMVKTQKPGQNDQPVYAAAIRIQNKFRSWKGRKEFLMTRQRIIKIQAHVRGHQVRKNYGNIIWSVGILEKVVLRWRRKGSGLRGFRSEALVDSSSMQDTPSKDDDYDFLKEGRKQTEERYQKALSRVKSMVQYPEARDQYRRLLTAVSEIHENKAKYDRVVDSSDETADFDEELIDLETLLGDDTFMPTAT